MRTSDWRWAAAKTIGTSHQNTGVPCQDFLASAEFEGVDGHVFAAVVSDGAGSASQSQAGARIVCGGFLRAVRAHLRSGLSLTALDEEIVLDGLDNIRERIGFVAARAELPRREWAATLVGLVIGPNNAVVVHVGDGAAVVCSDGSEDWLVPSWPYHGEYASTTAFVTDDPMPMPSIAHFPARVNGFALFSDGLERLVLDFAQRTAHRPFFDRIAAPVAASTAHGRDRRLSKALKTYLDSAAICDRTDDDKSLLVGLRL